MTTPACDGERDSESIPKPGICGHLGPLLTDKRGTGKLRLSKVGEHNVQNLTWQLLIEAEKLSDRDSSHSEHTSIPRLFSTFSPAISNLLTFFGPILPLPLCKRLTILGNHRDSCGDHTKYSYFIKISLVQLLLLGRLSLHQD